MTTGRSKAGRHEPARPKVGIFWVIGGKLISLGIPVTEGKGYGEYAIYEPSHYDKWRELQRSGTAPRDCEYEEFPRGRVMFNRQSETFLLLADTCILGDKQMLNRIMGEMELPKDRTVLDRDSHYRCFRCLGLG